MRISLFIFLLLAAPSHSEATPQEEYKALSQIYKGDPDGGPRLPFAHSLPTAASLPGKAYPLQGKNPTLGAYSGTLEWRTKADGKLEILRVVTYDSFRYEGFRVQEVWTGTGEVSNDRITAVFTLKRADVFDEVDGQARSKADYEAPLSVKYTAFLNDGHVESDLHESNEQITGAPSAGAAAPPWKNERWYMPSKGDSYRMIGSVANATVFSSITKKYLANPFIAPYQNRPEFKSKFHFIITDRTDFDFLRANPDTIRVANKVTDPISLAEAALKRDAFAPTLADKTAAFDKNFSDDHLNELGLYTSAYYEEGKPVRQVANGDGALWCGMYAGSQAMRWLTQKEPQALANFKRITKGLMLLMDITGDPKEFARTAEPYHGEPLSAPWKRGAAPYEGLKYIEGGNNDMVKGLFHAFAWAFEILPANDPFRAEVASHAKRLPGLKVNGELNHVRNIFFSYGLSALADHDASALASYFHTFTLRISPVDSLGLEQGYYLGGVADWSGINLKMVSQITEALIANSIYKGFDDASSKAKALKILKNDRVNLVETWGIYATAHKDFFTAAAYAFGATDGPLHLPAETRPAKWSKQVLWNSALDDVAWRLREFPTIRAKHVIGYNFSHDPNWSPSAWPSRPWKVYSEHEAIENFFQSAYDYPIFEKAGVGSDNFWTNGMEFSGKGPLPSEHGRVDYLFTYWLSRLAGLVADGS